MANEYTLGIYSLVDGLQCEFWCFVVGKVVKSVKKLGKKYCLVYDENYKFILVRTGTSR